MHTVQRHAVRNKLVAGKSNNFSLVKRRDERILVMERPKEDYSDFYPLFFAF